MSKRLLNLDEIIEQSLKNQADKIPVPPKEEVWAQIVNELEKQRTIKQRKIWVIKISVASIVWVFSMAAIPWVFPGNNATAIGWRIVQIFNETFGEQTRIETVSREDTSHDNEAPPTGTQMEIIQVPQSKVFTSLSEARKVAPFAFKVPKYVPKGYHFIDITFSEVKKESGEVVLRFKSDKNEIIIIEKKIIGDFSISSNVRTEEASTEKIEINGAKGTLTKFNNGFSQLEYYILGISTRISGQIDAQESIKIANSLQ